MKTINSFRSKLFALILALVASVSIQAHDFSVDGIYYNILDGNNVEVTFKGSHVNQYVNEYINSINIPNEVTINNTTYTVTRVGDGAFYACRTLNSVTIPNSVTYIGDTAFYSCDDLTTVDVGNAVTRIGDGAFFRCSSLTSIDIPDAVTSIGSYIFTGCSSLISIDIPDGVTSISDRAFWDCDALTSVTIGKGVDETFYVVFKNDYTPEHIDFEQTMTVIFDGRRRVSEVCETVSFDKPGVYIILKGRE